SWVCWVAYSNHLWRHPLYGLVFCLSRISGTGPMAHECRRYNLHTLAWFPLWFVLCNTGLVTRCAGNIFVVPCAMLYIAARAILLVLMFTTLRNLPPDAYKVLSWTTFVPHL
ncbi:hypothetical protein EDB19DRAFT_1753783, partial [Suillus lakei]